MDDSPLSQLAQICSNIGDDPSLVSSNFATTNSSKNVNLLTNNKTLKSNRQKSTVNQNDGAKSSQNPTPTLASNQQDNSNLQHLNEQQQISPQTSRQYYLANNNQSSTLAINQRDYLHYYAQQQQAAIAAATAAAATLKASHQNTDQHNLANSLVNAGGLFRQQNPANTLTIAQQSSIEPSNQFSNYLHQQHYLAQAQAQQHNQMVVQQQQQQQQFANLLNAYQQYQQNIEASLGHPSNCYCSACLYIKSMVFR